MDKLINDFNRGFSLKNDDLRFVDGSVRRAIADICLAMANGVETYIAWGCDVTIVDELATVTEGAIFHVDELYYVPAHTFAVIDPLPAAPDWILYYSYDPTGVKIDKDLQPHDTYQLRRAVGHMTGALPTHVIDTIAFDAIGRLPEILNDSATDTANNGVDVTGSLNLINSNGITHVDGELHSTVYSEDFYTIATFPGSFRPRNAMMFEQICSNEAGTQNFKILLKLSTSGVLSALLLTSGNQALVITLPFTSFIHA